MKKYNIIGGIGLIIFACCIISAELHKKGYCISEGRVLSDQEIFDIAARYAFEATQKKYSTSPDRAETIKENAKKNGIEIDEKILDKQGEYQVVPYKNFEEFLQKNPNCCEYYQRNLEPVGFLTTSFVPNPSFFTWVLGMDVDWVFVRYRIRIVNHSGGISTVPGTETYMMTNCGNYYSYD